MGLKRSRSHLEGRASKQTGKRQKRAGIFRADLEEVGYTVGCPGCRQAKDRIPVKNPHTLRCFERVLKEMERRNLPSFQRLREGAGLLHARDQRERCEAAGPTRPTNWQVANGRPAYAPRSSVTWLMNMHDSSRGSCRCARHSTLAF